MKHNQSVSNVKLETGFSLKANAIDVSKYQGDINWVEVQKANIEYAMIRATSGIVKDERFVANWEGAKAVGIRPGAYHYFRANYTAQEQAENLIERLSKISFNPYTDVLVIDVEKKFNEEATPDQMADGTYELLKILQNTSYEHLGIYASPNYWTNDVNWRKYDFSQYLLWIAHWRVQAPLVPETWINVGWKIWQFSNKGQIPGITGNVDLDIVKDRAFLGESPVYSEIDNATGFTP
ncbi:glycoside hydrolase family 25 protein [Candidatus Cardinium hertigii]|jgi:lysozyme|uniref:Glycosyl hydrolase family 25 n=1 Tax=Candidatus Cardinium hertigii TaxID=247481 RepID=A0A3N2QBE5_9BACT|nr:glycoside hydrolase family 25 protein [Candidatus Cardinium hertigii]ROT46959.1 glycosyl hydrolase family 25 [Candidatus Cardinium hertigii]